MKIISIVKSDKPTLKVSDFENCFINFFSMKSIHDVDNQDGVVIISDEQKAYSVFVIDGMGGHMGGEKATQIVVDVCTDFLDKFNSKDLRLTILDVLEIADNKIKELKIGAGATITAIELGSDFVRFYNAGDAFGLLVGARGKFKFKTIEHSPLGFGIEAGIVDRDDKTVESNLVSNGLGFESMRIEISQKMEVKNNDIIMLSSDGILNNYNVNQLISHITEGDFNTRLERLVNSIMNSTDEYLKDDTTIALIKIKS